MRLHPGFQRSQFFSTLLMIVSLQLCWTNIIGAERWIPKGPWGGRIYSVAVHPTDPSILYTGTLTGVYRSSDSGNTWVAVNDLSQVLTVVIDPKTASTIYVGTKFDGIYRSMDAGESWTEINSGLTRMYVRVLTIDPDSPSTLYAGNALAGVFRSTDGGDTWASLHPDVADLNVREITFHPDDSSTIYVGSSGGVHKSSDGGETWMEVNTGLDGAHVMSFAIDPVTPSTLYAGTAIDGAYWSTDNGSNWNPYGSGMENLWVSKFAFDTESPGTVYASTLNGGIFRKADQGEDWVPIVNGLTQTDVQTLVADRSASPILYAGTEDGLFRSEDGGDNWNSTNMGLLGTSIFTAVLDPVDPTTLYVGGYRGVFKSTDRCETWTAVNTGLTDLWVSSLAIDPQTPSTLFVGTRDGLFRSSDSGENWSNVFQTYLRLSLWNIVINPVSPSTIYAAGHPYKVLRSTDGGDTWDQVNSGFPEDISQVGPFVISPQDPTILYGGVIGGLYRSTDSGDNWSLFSDQMTDKSILALAIDPVTPSNLYVSTISGHYRSTDSGLTWTEIGNPIDYRRFNSLFVDPLDSSTIYGTSTLGVYRSTNHGETWVSSRSGLISTSTGHLILSKEMPQTMYVGTAYGGLHKAVPYGYQLPVAQIGDGGEILSSQVFLINPSDTEVAHAQLRPRDDLGDALEIDLNGKDIDEELDIDIPPSGMQVLKSDGLGDVTVGSVIVNSDLPISGGILVGGENGIAGFGPSQQLSNGFIAPVEANSVKQILTGIALVNLDESEMTVELALHDSSDSPLATSSVTLSPGGHLARFVNEFEWNQTVDFSDFLGLLKASAPSGLAATVIQTRPGEYATMPVIKPPEDESEAALLHSRASLNGGHELYFAQFGDGTGQLFSQILLFNLDDAKEAQLTLYLRNDAGQPLTVDLNGTLVEGEMDVTIPAGGLKLLQTDSLGSLVAGSVTVSSDRQIAGVILFGGDSGVAGVGAGEILTDGFMVPTESQISQKINTGVAIMNLEDVEVSVDLTLTDTEGKDLATSQIILPAKGHLARFTEQFEWSKSVDFSNFQGILKAETSGMISAIVIQTRPNQLATIPITTASKSN